jgi:hypothetical protein
VIAAGTTGDDRHDGEVVAVAETRSGHDPTWAAVVERSSAHGGAGGPGDQETTAVMTAEEAHAATARLLRQAGRAGRTVTTADVGRLTGRKPRQARRLLAQAKATVDMGSAA